MGNMSVSSRQTTWLVTLMAIGPALQIGIYSIPPKDRMTDTLMITGGHKGIGQEATRKILEQGGFDLILAGRNQTEVDVVARDLAARYGA